jgi:D-xylose 1-dehydrogenase (NADP+, D-xylono-1,5-lactone-forming)
MAEQTVRWGVLSTAKIGQGRVVPAIVAAEGAELVAIASRDGRKARRMARQFNAPRSYGDYQALLEDDEIDAVYNPLPNALHAQWTLKAAEHGKHILCEKPLTADAAEAADVVAACAEHGVRLMEAFMYRHHPQMAFLRKLLADGVLGEIRLVRASFGFTLTDRTNVRMIGDLAGGCTWDVGSYPVSFGRMVFGREPVTASATANMDPEAGVDVFACGWLDFDAGGRLLFDSSFSSAASSKVEVIGTEGTLTMPSPWIPGEGTSLVIYRIGDVDHKATIPQDDSYRLMVEHFMVSLPPEAPLPPPAEDGLANMRALDAVKASFLSNGQPVAVAQP